VNIVPAGPADVSAISRLEEELFDSPWSPAQVRSGLMASHSLWLVCRLGEEVVGFAGFRMVAADEAELLRLAVAPPWRRQGVASLLLTWALEDLAGRGVESCFLEVRSRNLAALRLYKRLGFVCQGTRPGYYRQPRDSAVVMARALTGIKEGAV